MSKLSRTISGAQRARGIETEGSVLVRMKAFIPMMGPLVLTSIQQTDERVLTLEARGFSAPIRKTAYYSVKNRSGLYCRDSLSLRINRIFCRRAIMSIIELENVTYRYPLDAEATIKNVDLSIEAGKVYGLIGSNQSGKTTLCNIMRGFIPAMFLGELKGTVAYKGKSIQEYNIGALAAEIGYSSQNPFTQISGVKDTVEEELAYGMENIGLSVEVMGKRYRNY